MPATLQIPLIALLAIILIPTAVRLGWMLGQSAYPLAIEAERGMDAAVEVWLLNVEIA